MNSIFFLFLVQNSASSADSSEMESLKKECEVAKKKCKEAQEKYFSESDRLKAIIDEMQGIIHVTGAFLLLFIRRELSVTRINTSPWCTLPKIS